MKGVDIIELLDSKEKTITEAFLGESKTPINIQFSCYSLNRYHVPKEIYDIVEECRGLSFTKFPEDKIEMLTKKLKEAYNLKEVYFIYNWEDEDYVYSVNDIMDKVMITDFEMNLRQFSESLLSTEDQKEFKDIK